MIAASFYIISFIAIGRCIAGDLSEEPRVQCHPFSRYFFFFLYRLSLSFIRRDILAVSHVIVYAGAIMVLLGCTLMMLNLNRSDEPVGFPEM